MASASADESKRYKGVLKIELKANFKNRIPSYPKGAELLSYPDASSDSM
jgi:hypothetical protein